MQVLERLLRQKFFDIYKAMMSKELLFASASIEAQESKMRIYISCKENYPDLS
jgi:hypothetical protein